MGFRVRFGFRVQGVAFSAFTSYIVPHWLYTVGSETYGFSQGGLK